MELTFDYEDLKEVFETMNITIRDVYFNAETSSTGCISVYMYWISPADVFNYYQDTIGVSSLYLQIKGKWFTHDEIDSATFIGSEMFDWIKTQKYINCRYFIDGTGSGTIGAHSPEHPCC
jgi:hypothetical protein